MKNKENVLKGTQSPDIDKTEDNATKSKEMDTEYAPGTHPHSTANLRPWSKGKSGNPLGKPSHAKLKKMLKEVGDEVVLDYKGNPIGTRKSLVLRTIYDKAIKGNNIKYIQHSIFIHIGYYIILIS